MTVWMYCVLLDEEKRDEDADGRMGDDLGQSENSSPEHGVTKPTTVVKVVFSTTKVGPDWTTIWSQSSPFPFPQWKDIQSLNELIKQMLGFEFEKSIDAPSHLEKNFKKQKNKKTEVSFFVILFRPDIRNFYMFF